MALGVPTITCDIAPINEFIKNGKNGILVECNQIGTLKNGLPVFEPLVPKMAEAISLLTDLGRASEMRFTTLEAAEKFSWQNTVSDFLEIIQQ